MTLYVGSRYCQLGFAISPDEFGAVAEGFNHNVGLSGDCTP